MKKIEVVAGVIFNNLGEVLITKRKLSKTNGGKWEFPGGKIEKNENEKDALTRELKEELNIEVEIVEKLLTTKSRDSRIILHSFKVILLKNEIVLNEHDEYKWLKIKDLSNYSFTEADLKILEFLILNYKS